MGRDADMGDEALEPVFSGGMALLSQARARLSDERLAAGLDGGLRAGLSVLLLDLATALMLLRAVAEGDMAAEAACDEAARLDLPEQVADSLTPALREVRAPALQVVLLQVSGLAAQVLALLDAMAEHSAQHASTLQSTELPPALDAAGPWVALEEAENEKPRQRPTGHPRLRLVSPEEAP